MSMAESFWVEERQAQEIGSCWNLFDSFEDNQGGSMRLITKVDSVGGREENTHTADWLRSGLGYFHKGTIKHVTYAVQRPQFGVTLSHFFFCFQQRAHAYSAMRTGASSEVHMA